MIIIRWLLSHLLLLLLLVIIAYFSYSWYQTSSQKIVHEKISVPLFVNGEKELSNLIQKDPVKRDIAESIKNKTDTAPEAKKKQSNVTETISIQPSPVQNRDTDLNNIRLEHIQQDYFKQGNAQQDNTKQDNIQQGNTQQENANPNKVTSAKEFLSDSKAKILKDFGKENIESKATNNIEIEDKEVIELTSAEIKSKQSKFETTQVLPLEKTKSPKKNDPLIIPKYKDVTKQSEKNDSISKTQLEYPPIFLLKPKVKTDKKTNRNILYWARTYYHAKKFKDSELQYRKLIELNPQNVKYYRELSHLYFEIKEIKKYNEAMHTIYQIYLYNKDKENADKVLKYMKYTQELIKQRA